VRRALASSVLIACGGDASVTGDGFVIQVDVSRGPLIAQIREGDGATIDAVIDLLAPITVLDAPAGEAPSRRGADLTLFGEATDGPVARAHLDLTITEVHPCEAEGACSVGPLAAPIPIGAVIGGDAFAPGAIRVDLSRGQIALFPDIAGNAAARGRLCEAVVRDPFHGGGTLFLGGTEVDFDARRIAVGACLSFDDDPTEPSDRGADVQLVVSTGLGPTILTESAYQRWVDVTGGQPVDGEPTDQLLLLAGPIDGWLRQIDRLALVGHSDKARGPCRQVYAHQFLTVDHCEEGDDCPCPEGASCQVPAIVQLVPGAPLDVLVVPDDDPTLQALRAEMRPESVEVDGILGTAALAAASLAVDVPHDRLLVRCEAAGCTVRPQLVDDVDRALVDLCRDREVDAPDATPIDAATIDGAPIDAL
jgi:hypothetical protein